MVGVQAFHSSATLRHVQRISLLCDQKASWWATGHWKHPSFCQIPKIITGVRPLTNVCRKQDLGPTTSPPPPQTMANANQAMSHSSIAQGTRKNPSFMDKNVGLSNADPCHITHVPCIFRPVSGHKKHWECFWTQKMGGKDKSQDHQKFLA